MSEWRKITCQERDAYFYGGGVKLTPYSSKTDLHGTYGPPEIYTEWADEATEQLVLRDHRYPGRDGEPDYKPCEHYRSRS